MALEPSIICLTEAYRDFFEGRGHVIEATADYGYPLVVGRRKVLLWSREPWRQVDPVGDAQLPAGRFVAGTTAARLGNVRVTGICVPWPKAIDNFCFHATNAMKAPLPLLTARPSSQRRAP